MHNVGSRLIDCVPQVIPAQLSVIRWSDRGAEVSRRLGGADSRHPAAEDRQIEIHRALHQTASGKR